MSANARTGSIAASGGPEPFPAILLTLRVADHLPVVRAVTYGGPQSLYGAVGRSVTALYLHHPETGATLALWVNKGVKLQRPEAGGWMNLLATLLVFRHELATGESVIAPGDWIAGPAALTGLDSVGGTPGPIADEWLTILKVDYGLVR